MARGPSSLGADLKAAAAAWRVARGGRRVAWHNLSELLAGRRLAIETKASLPAGAQTVLRTRLRLTGDSETEVLRGWLDAARPADIETLAASHFRAVASAGAGIGGVAATVRVVRDLLVAGPGLAAAAVLINDLRHSGWSALGSALLANRPFLAAIAVAGFGLLIRRAFRAWLRSRLSAGDR